MSPAPRKRPRGFRGMAKVDVQTCINEDGQLVIRVGGPDQAVSMEPLTISRAKSLEFAAVILLRRLTDGSLAADEPIGDFMRRIIKSAELSKS